MKKIIHTLLYMAILWVAMSFSNQVGKEKNDIIISLKHFVGDKILKLDSVSYKNELGQSFTVSKFKYYLSNIHLKNSSGKDFISNESFLIDEDEAGSKKIILRSVAAGNYTALDFIIGVDSIHNCSGAQSGALDPVNAMFWTWNTGYIFLKLEGNSKFSRSPGNFFEYHIGGYKYPANNIRKISLKLNEAKKTNQISVAVNILEILKTPTSIDFEKLSSITDLKNANIIADNYSDMFKLMPDEK